MLCPVGALALYLFTVFHSPANISTRPPFEPEFSDEAKAEGFGMYGKREWYSYKLFPGGKNPQKGMTYGSKCFGSI